MVMFAGLLASSPEEASSLQWTASPGCPQAEEGTAAVERLLTAPLTAERTVPVAVQVTLEPAIDGWVLTFAVETSSGRRERALKGNDCSELADTAALLAAVAIDPDTHIRDLSTPQPPPEAPPENAEPKKNDPSVSPLEKRDDARSLRWHAGVHAGLDIATLGRVGAMLGGSTGLRWRILRVDLGVLHRFVHRHAVTGNDRGEARVWNTAGTLDACGAPRVAFAEFPLCGGLEAGTLSGRSVSIRQPDFDRSLWLAFRARLGVVAWVHHRVGVTLTAMLLVPITRTRVRVEGRGLLYRVPPVAGAVNLGAEFRLW